MLVLGAEWRVHIDMRLSDANYPEPEPHVQVLRRVRPENSDPNRQRGTSEVRRRMSRTTSASRSLEHRVGVSARRHTIDHATLALSCFVAFEKQETRDTQHDCN